MARCRSWNSSPNKCHDNELVWLHLGTVYAHKELLEESEAAFARAEELEE